MRRIMPRTLIPLIVLLFLTACQQAPITGRRQLIMVSPGQEVAMGEEAFAEVKSQATLSGDARLTTILQRVGARIAAVAETIPGAENMAFQWEFILIESKQVNAFALPGGKVAVYTGILPVCKNEAGLAAVIGHEVGHVIARHGAERMSQNLIVEVVGIGLDAALQSKDPQIRNRVLSAYGLGSQVGVMLPYSRKHEYEADRIGMELMARAGYDPEEAPTLWDRMAQAAGAQPLEVLSTHPHSDKRAKAMRDVLATMNGYYRQASQQYGKGDSLSN